MCNYPKFPEGRTWAKCTPFTISNVCEENQKNELSHSVCGAGPQLWSLLSFLRSQETEAGGCVLSRLGVGGLGNFFFPWVNSNQCGLLETEIEKQTHILGLWLWFFHWHLWKPTQVSNFLGRQSWRESLPRISLILSPQAAPPVSLSKVSQHRNHPPTPKPDVISEAVPEVHVASNCVALDSWPIPKILDFPLDSTASPWYSLVPPFPLFSSYGATWCKEVKNWGCLSSGPESCLTPSWVTSSKPLHPSVPVPHLWNGGIKSTCFTGLL